MRDAKKAARRLVGILVRDALTRDVNEIADQLGLGDDPAEVAAFRMELARFVQWEAPDSDEREVRDLVQAAFDAGVLLRGDTAWDD